jgi:hypothetical protein
VDRVAGRRKHTPYFECRLLEEAQRACELSVLQATFDAHGVFTGEHRPEADLAGTQGLAAFEKAAGLRMLRPPGQEPPPIGNSKVSSSHGFAITQNERRGNQGSLIFARRRISALPSMSSRSHSVTLP